LVSIRNVHHRTTLTYVWTLYCSDTKSVTLIISVVTSRLLGISGTSRDLQSRIKSIGPLNSLSRLVPLSETEVDRCINRRQ